MFRGSMKSGASLWATLKRGADPSAKENLTLSLGQYDLSRKAFPVSANR
jgi:hypothetical protein